MKKRKVLLIHVILLFVGICLASSCSSNGKNKKPNIVIIYTDDQGTLDAGCYGANDLYTPNIDRLASMGVRFTQAYSHTVSSPSRAAMLTGRHPQRSGINDWPQADAHDEKRGVNMPLNEVTIAEVLKGNGYRTGLFGKWHLGSALEIGPQEQGFDHFYGFRSGFIDNYVHYFLHRQGFHDLWDNKEEVFERDNYFPSLMTDRAIQFIEENRKKPFFLYTAFNLPHYPEQPDSLFYSKYSGLSQPRKSYAAVMSTVDDKIGQIINKLEELDILSNTVIFFMSDNGHSTEMNAISIENHLSGLPKGTNYGANGGGGFTGKWRGAKKSFFEGGIRVPAIICYPGHFPKNVVRDQIISCMDFLPTICEITNSKLPDCKLDGYSLLPIIESKNSISQHQVLYFQWQDNWMVREGRWKLIDNTSRLSNAPEKILNMEYPFLADLESINPEEFNCAKEYPEIVEKLTELYEEWAADVFKY